MHNFSSERYMPGELLQMYRKRGGLTQAALARVIGLQSKRMVQSWEAGEALPKSERLKQLIELYITNKVFIAGHERQEARELWESVKRMHDATASRLALYPIFDKQWLEALIQKKC